MNIKQSYRALLILTMAATNIAFADILTERVFDTTLITSEKGQGQLMPTYRYGEARVRIDFFGESLKHTQPFQGYGFSYLYGVGQNTSIGTNLFWRYINGNEDDKDGSFLDPEVFLRSKTNITSDLSLFYGGVLSLSPEPSQDDNQYSGGSSIKGDIGVRRYLNGPNSLVGFAALKLWGERKSEDTQGTAKNKGNHELQVHAGYEHSVQGNRIGGTIGVLKLLKGTYGDSYGNEEEAPEVDYAVGNLYGILSITNKLSIIPSFKYLQNLDGRDAIEIQWFSGSLTLGMIF